MIRIINTTKKEKNNKCKQESVAKIGGCKHEKLMGGGMMYHSGIASLDNLNIFASSL